MNIVIKGYKTLPKSYIKQGWLMQNLVQDHVIKG